MSAIKERFDFDRMPQVVESNESHDPSPIGFFGTCGESPNAASGMHLFAELHVQ
jgi:hypothetical protein